MKVVIRGYGGDQRIIDIPTWHYELFNKDPDEYLEPFLAGLQLEADWEVMR